MEKLEGECDNNFERWIYILKNMEKLKEIPYKEVNDMWADFEIVADTGSMSREERRDYESSLNSYRVLLSAFEQTAAEWHQHGYTEGHEQGLAEGRAEGRAEALLSTVRNMRVLGLSDETICEVTGLTIEQLQKI